MFRYFALLSGVLIYLHSNTEASPFRDLQPQPNGHLLLLKVLQIDQSRQAYYYNHVSLFKVTLNGQVTELWNISLQDPHLLFTENGFAIDIQNQLVYLSIVDQFLAVDLNTGQVKIRFPLEPPNLQYFTNYDYSPKDKTIYGICTGNSAWNWCSIKQTGNHSAVVDIKYTMPYLTEFGPISCIYDIDVKRQLIWYYPNAYVVGVNYTTGEKIFISGPSNGTCIGHDSYLNRTFVVLNDVINEKAWLSELQPQPGREIKLLDLPSDLRLDYFGSCVYDQETHTMIGVMGDMNMGTFFYHGMPTALLIIDVVNLSYERIPLPAFKEQWDDKWSITAVKFVPE